MLYRRVAGGAAYRFDLTGSSVPPVNVDAGLIIGGLHHCVADLQMTLRNVATMIKPGGSLMMMEPNSDYLLEAFRRIWYRLDRLTDADTERALDHQELVELAQLYFEPQLVVYFGGPAYFFILNSMMTRVPLGLKPYIAPTLFSIESLYNHIPGRWAYPVFLAQWLRTDAPFP